MNKCKLRLSVVFFGASLAMPVAAEDVNETTDAASDGHVEIVNISGSIEVFGWSKSSVEVTGEIGNNVDELIVERNGDRVLIKVKVPRNSHGGISSDLTIRLPEDSSIDVSGVSSDIDVEGVNGEQTLHTVSGDIDTHSTGGDVSAESVSGDIEVAGNDEDTDTSAHTVSGDITLDQVSGAVAAEAVSGDITIDGGSFDRVSLNSVNGEIVFHGELHKGGKMNVETVNGDVDAEFGGKLSAKFDVETFNGDIENCYGHEAQRTSKYAPGYELSFTQGDGDGRIEIATLNGDIDICND